MANWNKICFLILTLITIYAVGCLIFTRGFLLKRFVVNENSSCNVDFSIQNDDHVDLGCWQHSRFKRAIIIVIDALKYEFLKYDHRSKSQSYFLNKLPLVDNLLRRKPRNSRLYKFMADPPTTTLQRLKGLTTGSLPTFVDAGANFASTEITEDNIIDQLNRQNRRLVFMGDDTWNSLFPNRFVREYPFPSFNVKDLHTVDNGVLKHLIPEMRKHTWDVLIAHFLGVDHCGHRFGPNHPAMAEKLTQMDEMLSNVTRMMKDDTILFVLGDHGMTAMGDHGGDSPDEVEAGLFVYSPAQLSSSLYNEAEDQTVSQIDLVPTLALLLGVPIPFSNLGMIIHDLFSFCSWWKSSTSEIKQVYHMVKALRLNAHQINGYVNAYSSLSSDFPKPKMDRLRKLLDHAESDLQSLLTSMVKEGETPGILKRFKILEKHYTDFISEIKEICQGIWAKFDMGSMFTGILTMMVGFGVNILFIRTVSASTESSWTPLYIGVGSSIAFVIYAILQTLYLSEFVSPFMLFVFGGMLVLLLSILIHKSFFNNPDSSDTGILIRISFEDKLAGVVALVYMCVYFSNSFVVWEDSVTLFLSQTLTWMFGLKAIKQILSKMYANQKSHKESAIKHKSKSGLSFMLVFHPLTITFFLTVTCSLCLRLSAPFRACREEQWTCNTTIFMEPLALLAYDAVGYRNVRYFFSVACLAVFVISLQQWMKFYGNLNGYAPSVLCAKFAFPLAGICCVLHWAAQGLPEKVLDALPWWQQILLAQTVYITVIISLVILVLSPLCIYKLPSSTDSAKVSVPYSDLYGAQVIPHVYRQLKRHWKEHDGEEKPPMVYGLGSVYSASVVQCITATGLILSLLLGDGIAPSLLLALVATYLLLELYAAGRSTQVESDSLLTVPWSLIITLALYMSTFFFATGHQATVPAIRFESAFTGFHGDFQYNIIPAILITINTYASQIFFVVISPLLIFWPHLNTFASRMMRLLNKSDSADRWRGDFVACDDPGSLRRNIVRVVAGFFLFSALKVFSSMCAACLHRRHLMVWKIFAPRFVFEGAAMFVVFGACILMYLFLARVDRAVNAFANSLSK